MFEARGRGDYGTSPCSAAPVDLINSAARAPHARTRGCFASTRFGPRVSRSVPMTLGPPCARIRGNAVDSWCPQGNSNSRAGVSASSAQWESGSHRRSSGRMPHPYRSQCVRVSLSRFQRISALHGDQMATETRTRRMDEPRSLTEAGAQPSVAGCGYFDSYFCNFSFAEAVLQDA